MELFYPDEVIEIAKIIGDTNMASGSSEVHIAFIRQVANTIYRAGFRKEKNVQEQTARELGEKIIHLVRGLNCLLDDEGYIILEDYLEKIEEYISEYEVEELK